ncbi:hypothetical protein [Prevotella denticola]|nr:hypothetical protein [Prevotella denticola]MBW4713245.1 hypothetical protein [Prevotella denticola]MBW4751068.1 hypothetical protein [Prevotella denticola]
MHHKQGVKGVKIIAYHRLSSLIIAYHRPSPLIIAHHHLSSPITTY